MSERRKATRQKSFLHGCIYFNNRRSAIDCLVRDVSAEGAKLIMSEVATIPNVVDLYIPQRGETLRARVQWRTREEAGVVFESARARATAGAGLAERIEQLEAEVAALKRTLKRMKADESEAAA
jgi:PilZ domain